jgi:low affinity Fe/Cu permease
VVASRHKARPSAGLPPPHQAGLAPNGRLLAQSPSLQFGHVTGPLFHYSDPWQLVINTGTTIITFLMVFIIQNTQNRDARAINLKLDELIHAIDTAKNQMMDIEKLSDDELDVIHERYTQIRADCDDEEAEAKT